MRLIGVAAILALFAAPAQAAESVIGRFVTQNRKAIVTIERCGTGVCGHISKLLPAADYGKTVDERNADPKLRTRPLVGLPILLDFHAERDQWRGHLYDPQAGDTYSSTMRRNPDGSLRVRGCFFFICKTQIWPKAE